MVSSTQQQQQSMCQTIARYAFGFLLVLYAAAMFVWQHKHLNKLHSGDRANLLSTSKEAFYRQSLQIPIPSQRTVSQILNNPKLPTWVKQYAKWHKEQRTYYLDAKRNNESTSHIKFLISRCLTNDKCGGASDRLQDMPYNMMLANRTNRVLLVRWEKPASLEHYLIPPIDGPIDWTIQDEMNTYLKDESDWHLRGNEEDVNLQIVSTIRRDSAAPKFRAYENDIVGHKM